jgi:hypothetical protein
LRYHTSSQLGELLRELREERRSYFGRLTYHLAVALFFTGCPCHEWARLTFDRLVHEPGGVILAARLQLKGGSFRDAGADAIATAEQKVADLKAQIDAHRKLSTSLDFDELGSART